VTYLWASEPRDFNFAEASVFKAEARPKIEYTSSAWAYFSSPVTKATIIISTGIEFKNSKYLDCELIVVKNPCAPP
jgi:hypothetical protein